MIDHIDFDKLLPYKDDKKHSFEEMCYQLCLEEFKQTGSFTSIDDSGGGDGVEYYLTLSNGDIWGWQCKFFDRFDEGGRKEQIKKSLKRAYAIHGNKLKKWYLCSKKSQTEQERVWFETKLRVSIKEGQPILPTTAPTLLIHWGDSEILSLLRKHTSIYNFFFNDKILSFSWFKNKADETFRKQSVKTKYDSELYCSINRQREIFNRIGGKKQAKELTKLCKDLHINSLAKDYKKAINDLQYYTPQDDFKRIFETYSPIIISYVNLIDEGNNIINKYKYLLTQKDLYEQMDYIPSVTAFCQKFKDSYNTISDVYHKIESSTIGWEQEESCKDLKQKEIIKKHRNKLLDAYFVLQDYYGSYISIFEEIGQITQQELHITGNASQGKSNLAINLFDESIKNMNPAIFLLGSEFKNNSSIEDQILQLLDLRGNWNFERLLQVLDMYGKLSNSKALFIIDGLNENNHWKEIWSDNIDRIIAKFNPFKYVLFITTYRASYESEIFPKNYFQITDYRYLKRIIVSGYHINVNEAIQKYSHYFNVTISRKTSAINIFRNEPICLKLFFKAHKGQTIELIHDTIIDAFDEFLNNCKNNIYESLGTKYKRNRVETLLDHLTSYIWEYDTNGIPLDDLSDFNDTELEAFDHEDILLYRDFHKVEEFCFTYDLIAGYLIAIHLLGNIKNREELKAQAYSDLFRTKLIEKKNPLFDVIIKCYILFASRKFGIGCCIDLPFDIDYIMDAIYGTSTVVIAKEYNEIAPWLEKLFLSNPKIFIDRIFDVALEPNNKLNFKFYSQLLKCMSLRDRDLSWTEHICKPYTNRNCIGIIKGFEDCCKNRKGNKDKLYLGAHIAMWCLSSINHQQRFDASRALYWYGRKHPIDYLELLKFGSDINDPYITERLYGVAYGIALSMQSVERNNPLILNFILPLSRLVYDNFFCSKNNTNCHFLSRIYCRGIVELAKTYGASFSKEEEKRIFSPVPRYKKSDIETWKEKDSFDHLIRMDFSNYQLGHLITDGGGYSNPPLKKKARWFLNQRIRELGWSEDYFETIDKAISNDNYYRQNDHTKIDRYGKKYSWIAYYELAGILDDIGLLQNDWNEYRPIKPDFDPSFPESDSSIELLKDNFLGNNSITTKKWIETDTPINLHSLLYGKYLETSSDTFICMYGYFCSLNKDIGRRRFSFIRPLIVKSDEYNEFKSLLSKQNLGGRWLPEIQTNYDIFAGEMYLPYIQIASNNVEVSFVTGQETIDCLEEDDNDELSKYLSMLYSEKKHQRNRRIPTTKKYNVLLPTMEYNYETVFSHGIGRCISHEIALSEKLLPKTQSFEMIDSNGDIASINTQYSVDYNNNQHFVFLRKDILDNYLKKNGMKMVWAIWGEKDYAETPLTLKVFQQIEEYDMK